MKFFAAKCPQCSGDLQLPEDKDIVKCMYCSSDIVISKLKEQAGPKLETLLKLARHAKQARNHSEAETYFSRVLESDPNCYEAWLGKSEAAAWQSTLAHYRGDELLAGCEQAIALAKEVSDEEAERVQKLSAESILNFAQTFHSLSVDHTIQFISVPSARYEHWDRCRLILSLCEKALDYQPNLSAVNSFCMDVCNRCLNVSMIGAEDKAYFKAKKLFFSKLDQEHPRQYISVDAAAKKEAGAQSIEQPKEPSFISQLLTLCVALLLSYICTGAALDAPKIGGKILFWLLSCGAYIFTITMLGAIMINMRLKAKKIPQ